MIAILDAHRRSYGLATIIAGAPRRRRQLLELRLELHRPGLPDGGYLGELLHLLSRALSRIDLA